MCDDVIRGVNGYDMSRIETHTRTHYNNEKKIFIFIYFFSNTVRIG